jgi:hypothetical protein
VTNAGDKDKYQGGDLLWGDEQQMVITMAEELRHRGRFVGGAFVRGIFVGGVFIGGVFVGGMFIGGALVRGDVIGRGTFIDGTIIWYCTVVNGQ